MSTTMAAAAVRSLLLSWKLSEIAVDKILGQGYDDFELLESLEPTTDNLNALNFERLVDKTMFITRWTEWKEQRDKIFKSTPSLSTVTLPSDDERFASPRSADCEIDYYLEALSSENDGLEGGAQSLQTLTSRRLVDDSISSSHIKNTEATLSDSDRLEDGDRSHIRNTEAIFSDTGRLEDGDRLLQAHSPSIYECNPLRSLLRKSVHTKSLLNITKRPLEVSEWRLLSRTIIDHLLTTATNNRTNNAPKLSYADLKEWSEYLVKVFPCEKHGVWFALSPAVKGSVTAGARQSPNRSSRASGRLWQRYNNAKEHWRKSNNVPRRMKSEASTSEQRNEHEKEVVPDEDLLREVREDILTIENHNSVEVNTVLLAAWKDTVKSRREFMKTLPTVGDYLDRFPVLRNPKTAYKLIEEEFSVLYPNTDTSALYKGLRRYADIIIKRAERKYSRATNEQKKAQLAVKELSVDDEFGKATAALVLLPYCVFGAKVDDKGKKGSRLDAVSRFVYLAKTRSEGEAYLEKLKEEFSSGKKRKGAERLLGVQPFVIAVGENWASVNTAFVIVDCFLYSVTSILDAVDLCFKCMFVFDLSYPKESEHVWQFLQFAIYSIKYDPKMDKYIAGVQEFLGELDVQSEST